MADSEQGINITQQADKNNTKHPHKTDKTQAVKNQSKEVGGPKGLEPTRYGDWERNGRCVDF